MYIKKLIKMFAILKQFLIYYFDVCKKNVVS